MVPSETERKVRRGAGATLALALLLATAGEASAFRWPWSRGHPWPKSSEVPVTPLGHPRVEERFAALDASDPFRFAVFGDQRALANGEWQEMIGRIVALHEAGDEIAFLVDSGDVVQDGTHSDQFEFLKTILAPAGGIPYLVGLGNHEVHNMKNREARENAAVFFSYLDPKISTERFYYRKDLGPATLLFLDTNPFVYGSDGERKRCPHELERESSAAGQMKWLRAQLEDVGEERLVIVTMHHPFVQSSEKHREASASLWNCVWEGTTMPELLADGGADLVLVGHTHTYERFRLERDDGRGFDLVNVSGRPTNAVLWFGSGGRRARDIRGEEREDLAAHGWDGLEAWRIVQEDLAPKGGEANQFAVFTVGPTGSLSMQVHFLDDDEGDGLRSREPVRLR